MESAKGSSLVFISSLFRRSALYRPAAQQLSRPVRPNNAGPKHRPAGEAALAIRAAPPPEAGAASFPRGSLDRPRALSVEFSTNRPFWSRDGSRRFSDASRFPRREASARHRILRYSPANDFIVKGSRTSETAALPSTRSPRSRPAAVFCGRDSPLDAASRREVAEAFCERIQRMKGTRPPRRSAFGGRKLYSRSAFRAACAQARGPVTCLLPRSAARTSLRGRGS